MWTKLSAIFLIAIFSAVAVAAQDNQKGANTFFAARTDEDAACVLDNDTIIIQAFQPLVKPNGDWLAKGSAGGFVAYITVSSDNDQPVKHSVLKEVQFVQDDKQNSFVRLNETMLIANHLIIKQPSQPKITSISLAFEYIGKKSPTAWGAGLQTMASLANILPLPPSPYTSAAKSLAQFTSGLVSKSLEVDKPGVQDPKADLDIPLYGSPRLPTGKTRCMGQLEVGAYALVDAWPTTGDDDYVDVGKPTNYCMKAEPGGAAANVTFWFQKRTSSDGAGTCTGTGDYHVLGNPHIPVLVTAITSDDETKKANSNEFNLPIGIGRRNGEFIAENMTHYSREARTSAILCQKLKIPLSQCFGVDTGKLPREEKNKLFNFEKGTLK